MTACSLIASEAGAFVTAIEMDEGMVSILRLVLRKHDRTVSVEPRKSTEINVDAKELDRFVKHPLNSHTSFHTTPTKIFYLVL